jgi:hypothetical protein
MAGSLMAALAVWIQAAPARALEAFPPYPQGFNTIMLGRWLTTQTDVPLASVVLTGPGYVFSFVPPDPSVPGDKRVWKHVREEVTGDVLAEALGGRSATATVAFDCRRGEASASSVVIFAGNNLQGDLGHAVPAAQWMAANPGAYLMELSHAACDPAFRRPFAGPPAPAPAQAPKPRAAVAGAANRWVQVGAFGDAASANQHWRSIQQTLPSLVVAQTVRLEPVHPGGGLVRALVGPFADADAHAFCDALKTRGDGDCLVL